MIRYVFIGKQIYEKGNVFAFFDTVTDRFVSVAGEHIFDSVSDFMTACRVESNPDMDDLFARCLGLIDRKRFK